jgi:DNA-binding PadR family transcriptional regulator
MAEAAIEADHITVLRLFERSKNGVLKGSEISKKLGMTSKQGVVSELHASVAGHALSSLVARGDIEIISESKDGPGATYRLTEQGKEYNRPARPDIPDQQLEAQEAFILLQFFRAKEQRLTRSELNGKLKTKAAVGQLEFDVQSAPGTIDYHLVNLVRNGCLDQEWKSRSVAYTLNSDHGTTALAAARQHDAVSFTMTGELLNALVAAVRKSNQPPSDGNQERKDGGDGPPSPAPPHSTPIGPSDITKAIEQLRSNLYASHDKIPIHAVRQFVASHHGEQAASHTVLDPLIVRMRSDGQLRLIAISDSRDATQQDLNNSIPGMNETLFYIVTK